jgi:hypothetical protein
MHGRGFTANMHAGSVRQQLQAVPHGQQPHSLLGDVMQYICTKKYVCKLTHPTLHLQSLDRVSYRSQLPESIATCAPATCCETTKPQHAYLQNESAAKDHADKAPVFHVQAAQQSHATRLYAQHAQLYSGQPSPPQTPLASPALATDCENASVSFEQSTQTLLCCFRDAGCCTWALKSCMSACCCRQLLR